MSFVDQVEKNARLLTIQWSAETLEGEEEEYEEEILAPWPGKVRIRNLKNCEFSEMNKVILKMED